LHIKVGELKKSGCSGRIEREEKEEVHVENGTTAGREASDHRVVLGSEGHPVKH
jgi:hypothetical protein